MGWTRIGSVSVANGNPIVYGNGTVWASGVTRAGDTFKAPDGRDYEVLSVQSNTQLTLASPYLGTTANAQAYAIINTGLLPAELAVDLSNLQSKYLATVAQLYEWETSAAATVPLTNPATGVTANVTPLTKFLSDTQTALGGKANAENPTTAGTLTHIGNAGIGTATPRAAHHVQGAGQATANLTDAGPRGDMLRVSGIGTPSGTGGAITFANSQGDTANSVGFAAIKGLLADGSANTAGHLAFSTRNSASDTSLTERLRIDASGNVLVTSAAGLGYGIGSGGTVTQATSKSTPVTLNKPSGIITTHSEALAAGAKVSFAVNNTLVQGSSVPVVIVSSNTVGDSKRYRASVTYVTTGVFYICIENIREGTCSDAVYINFALLSGATS